MLKQLFLETRRYLLCVSVELLCEYKYIVLCLFYIIICYIVYIRTSE